MGSLPYNVTSAQLEDLFAQAGKVASVNLITDRYSGQSKGFAFVEMETDKESDEAIKKFNNFEFEGRRLVVNEARPQEKRQDFGHSNNSFSRSKKSW